MHHVQQVLGGFAWVQLHPVLDHELAPAVVGQRQALPLDPLRDPPAQLQPHACLLDLQDPLDHAAGLLVHTQVSHGLAQGGQHALQFPLHFIGCLGWG